MSRRLISSSVAVLLLWIAQTGRADAPATQPGAPEKFMRFVDDGHGGGSLQTADVAFVNKDGVEVDLVAAVHIGEKSYYDGLNKDFKNYDAVLYELVSPKDSGPPTPEQVDNSTNPISEFQQFLKDALDLDFQLDDVNYQAANFVHADLDKETFEKLQEEKGETFEDLMMKQIMNAFTQPAPDDKANNNAAAPDDSAQDLIKILTRPDMERQIKVVLAKQLGDMDTAAMGLDGPGGSVIVTDRNTAAFKVLSDTLAGGKKKIAIFYGAAHMPDMTKRLTDMGFTPKTVDWKVAWDLAIRPDQPSAAEKLLTNLFNAFDDNGNN
jgi:hypothetical protein